MAGNRTRAAAALIVAGVALSGGVAIVERASQALDGVTLRFAGGDVLRVGAVTFENGLIGAALAQSGDVTLEDVEFTGPLGTYRIPRVVFRGANLGRAELDAAFTSGDASALWRTLARLSATSVSIPEISWSQTLGEFTQTYVYRGVEARDVVEGKVASLTAEGATFAANEADDRFEGSMGAASFENLDLALMLRFYAEAAGDGPNELSNVYDSFAIDDVVFGDGGDFEMRIAAITGSEFQLRLLAEPLPETMRFLEEIEDKEELTPEETKRSLEFIADMFESVAFGPIEAVDVTMKATGAEPFEASIDSVAFDPTGSLGFTGMRIQGIAGETPAGSFSVQSIASEGFSVEPALEGLRRMAADPTVELEPDAIQRMMPVIGTTTITGVASDIAPSGPGSEVNFSLGSMSFTADEPYNGVPTNVRFSFSNLAFDVPENSGEEFLEQMRGLGYERLDLTGALAARWNEAADEIVLSEVAFGGVDIGMLSLRGVLGGVGPELFSADEDERIGALIGGGVKNVHLMVENAGVVEQLLSLQASDMGMRPEEVAEQFGTMAEGMLPAMLGGSDQARQLGQAIRSFLVSPGELEISATARDSGGVAVMEFLAMSNPAELMERIDLTAVAR